jgi:hypothetical protein
MTALREAAPPDLVNDLAVAMCKWPNIDGK